MMSMTAWGPRYSSGLMSTMGVPSIASSGPTADPLSGELRLRAYRSGDRPY
jgi:hypothetical protein